MRDIRAALLSLTAVAAVTFVYARWLHVTNATIVSAPGDGAVRLEERQLTEAFEDAARSLEFDAYARTYAGHRSMDADARTVRLVPLRVGTKPIGLLAASGRPVEPGTLDTLAGVVAISSERMRQFTIAIPAAVPRASGESAAP